MIVRKAPPLVALMIGTLLGGLFALFYQPHLVLETWHVGQVTAVCILPNMVLVTRTV